MGPGPHSALETLLVCSSERLIPENWGGSGEAGGEIFILSLAFIVFSNFPNHIQKRMQA